MKVPATSSNEPASAETNLASLAVAALEALGFEVTPPAAHGTRTVRPAQSDQEAAPALPVPEYQGRTSFTFSAGETHDSVEPLAFGSPLWHWLLEQLAAHKRLVSASPVGDPQAVHEFSGALLQEYQVDGGSVHLAGCRLEAVPFVRVLSFDGQGLVSELVVAPTPLLPTGEQLSASLIKQLHLNDWEFADSPRNISLREQSVIYDAADSVTAGWSPDGHEQQRQPCQPGELPPLLVALWCHRASGKIEFEIGDAALTVTFDDWARNLKPPPITCPVTSEATYHLAITGDGRLIAAEQLAPCSVCRQQLPRTELATSAVSGALACEQHATHCPVTGETALADELVECPTTHLHVSPSAVRGGKSTLLEQLEPVDASETALARLRLDHAVLDSYGSWKLARGADVDLYVGSKLVGRILVAIQRDTGELLAAASKTKLGRNWKPLELEVS